VHIQVALDDYSLSEKSRGGLFHWLRPDAASQPREADSPPERALDHDVKSGETGAAGADSANLRWWISSRSTTMFLGA
jgi:hypothetical protein